MDKFDKLLEKKGRKLSGVEKRAKSDVLSGLQEEALNPIEGKLAGLKKVSVASPSKEGLEKGLDKAREILGDMSESEDEDSYHKMPDGKLMKDGEMEDMHHGELSVEEIDAKIQMLMDLKKQLLEKE